MFCLACYKSIISAPFHLFASLMDSLTVESFFPKKATNIKTPEIVEERSNLTNLPEEILLKIFSKIEIRYLIYVVSKTCKTFYCIICSDGTWKSILRIKFPDFQDFKPSDNDVYLSSWREAACSYDEALLLRSYSLQRDKMHTVNLSRSYAPVDSVHIMPGSRFCISGMGDRTLNVWDVDTHQCMRVFEAHEGWIWSIKSNEDQGNQFASASWDTTVKLWDLNRSGGENEMLIDTFDNHPAAIISMSFQHNLIVTGCYDKKIRLIDPRSNSVVQTISQHEGSILSLLELNENIIISGSEDETVGVYDKRACKSITNVSVGTQVLAMNSSKENGFDYLRASGLHGSMYIYNISHEQLLLLDSYQLWKTPSKTTSLATFHGSVVVGSEDGTVRFYSPGLEAKLLSSACMHTSAVVDIHVRDAVMATASNDLGLTRVNQ